MFGAALHVEFFLRRDPDGQVVGAHLEHAPAVVAAAHALGRLSLRETAAAGMPLAAVFDAALASLD
ncbi:MAG TPA: hypothetical protein VFW14_14500 [Gaiellales bacterium]|nr:hypothetical protein [Gaiellales bacterium]